MCIQIVRTAFNRVCNTHSLVRIHRIKRLQKIRPKMEIIVYDNYAIANLSSLMNIVMNFNQLKMCLTNNTINTYIRIALLTNEEKRRMREWTHVAYGEFQNGNKMCNVYNGHWCILKCMAYNNVLKTKWNVRRRMKNTCRALRSCVRLCLCIGAQHTVHAFLQCKYF